MSDFRWHRIEPHARDADYEEALQARIADPLWMLARQWQVGEFHGEDAASPIHVRLRATTHPLRTFRNGARRRAPVEPARTGVPLETRVEAEDVSTGPSAVRLAADAGVQFLRRLALAGLDYAEAFISRFPFDEAPGGGRLPARERRRLALMARRGLDGRRLFAAGDEELEDVVAAGDRDALRRVAAEWRAEYAGRFHEPGEGGETWVENRLEYRFSVGAATGDGQVVLAAEEYAGGHLDWYSFDVVRGPSHGLRREQAEPIEVQTIPVPLAFPGMPVSRWWEFEEGTVYFGGIEAGPADIGRLMVAEYATISSDDWYVVPLRLPVGSLSRVTAVWVIDTFGRGGRNQDAVRSTGRHDRDALSADDGGRRPWAFFELAGDRSLAPGRKTPWLFLAPSYVGTVDGRPVENVTFLRDEAANLAWGVEEVVEAPTGRPVRRREQWATAASQATDAPEAGQGPSADGLWRYGLQTAVPPYWIPFMAERQRDGVQMRLRRARMSTWDHLPDDVVGPQGRILDPGGPLRLHEEEVPRGGVEVTRAWQAARGADGRLHVWMGRRKRPGIGERASGLGFDQIDRG